MISLRARYQVLMALLAVVALVVAAGAGYLLPSRETLILPIAVAAIIFTLGLSDAALIALICLPLFFLTQRVGGGGTNLSISDLAIALCVGPAIVASIRPFSTRLRSVLWYCVIYQATTVFTLVANPYRANFVEWFHEWLLVAGALIVGWTVGRDGRQRAAFAIMLTVACFLGFGVILKEFQQIASGQFQAVYATFPFPMHKNFAGTLCGTTALVAYARPAWSGIGKRTGTAAFWWLAIATGCTLSRQALVGLAVGVAVLVFRSDGGRRRSQLIILAAIPLLVVISVLVNDQVHSDNKFNSASQRLNYFTTALDVWSHGRIFGVGLRWWYTNRFAIPIQPPNAELEVLSSAGIVGLLGLLVLFAGMFRAIRRMDVAFGTLALSIFLNRIVQAQFDVFWVAVATSLPMFIIGVCLGAEGRFDAEKVMARRAHIPVRVSR